MPPSKKTTYTVAIHPPAKGRMWTATIEDLGLNVEAHSLLATRNEISKALGTKIRLRGFAKVAKSAGVHIYRRLPALLAAAGIELVEDFKMPIRGVAKALAAARHARKLADEAEQHANESARDAALLIASVFSVDDQHLFERAHLGDGHIRLKDLAEVVGAPPSYVRIWLDSKRKGAAAKPTTAELDAERERRYAEKNAAHQARQETLKAEHARLARVAEAKAAVDKLRELRAEVDRKYREAQAEVESLSDAPAVRPAAPQRDR